MKPFSNIGLLAAAGAMTLAWSAPSVVLAENITAVSWGGAYSMSQRKAIYEPFMKDTGNTVLEDEWTGDMSTIRAIVETKNYKWDVIDAETNDVLAGCDEGILEPIDYARMGLDMKKDFVAGGALECGVGVVSWATVYAYRTDVYTSDPPNGGMKDFWNIEKYPGKRGLYRHAAPNLEFALFADGVPRGDVYKVLRTDAGKDRAFAKLDQIKAHVVWWEPGAQPPQLLADKEVVMTTGWNGRFYSAIKEDKQPFQIVWTDQIYDFEYWVIPKGHPKTDLIYEFIAYASRPDRQGDMTNWISYGPTRLGSDKFVNPDILPHLPTAPKNASVGITVDSVFWADNNDDLEERFNTWVAKE